MIRKKQIKKIEDYILLRGGNNLLGWKLIQQVYNTYIKILLKINQNYWLYTLIECLCVKDYLVYATIIWGIHY